MKMAQGRVQPFYLACDVSSSMQGDPVAMVNRCLRELHVNIASDPAISEDCRLSVVSFSDRYKVVMPMSNAGEVQAIAPLEAGGQTNVGALFSGMHEQIALDVDALREQGLLVRQPAIYLITDGKPTDQGWDLPLAALKRGWPDRPAPQIVCFGTGHMDMAFLQRVSTTEVYTAANQDPVGALRSFIGFITKSLISTTRRSTENEDTVVLHPDGSLHSVPALERTRVDDRTA